MGKKESVIYLTFAIVCYYWLNMRYYVVNILRSYGARKQKRF